MNLRAREGLSDLCANVGENCFPHELVGHLLKLGLKLSLSRDLSLGLGLFQCLVDILLELVGSLVQGVRERLGEACGGLANVLRDQSEESLHVFFAEVLQCVGKLCLSLVEHLVADLGGEVDERVDAFLFLLREELPPRLIREGTSELHLHHGSHLRPIVRAAHPLIFLFLIVLSLLCVELIKESIGVFPVVAGEGVVASCLLRVSLSCGHKPKE